MVTWTNKQWGALIGGLVVFLIALIGLGPTALVVLAAVIGYFIGKFLDGEIDDALSAVRAGKPDTGTEQHALSALVTSLTP